MSHSTDPVERLDVSQLDQLSQKQLATILMGLLPAREEIEIYLMERCEKPSVMAVVYLLNRKGICAGVVDLYSKAGASRDVVFRDRIVELVRQYGAHGVYIGMPRFEECPSMPTSEDCFEYEELQVLVAKEGACLMDILIINNGLIQSVAAWWKHCNGPESARAFELLSAPVSDIHQCYGCGVYRKDKPGDEVCVSCEAAAVEESRADCSSLRPIGAVDWVFIIAIGIFCIW